ncbi:zinc transport system substrate-binding protein [Methanomicrobium sp. W14]|uniref:metal ABC transporter solute-binding protein, Zn/Mn family n=1 Tax=Methanomicrobium sp. W14 TaxID=2817839 RepID=UPI001AE802C9|nr:zinc ABC transporter substrate-binding protein [Methanomicrobium sp. W14]MBP2133062.1 zinc transport system substrate-binding protein [Methanomicrobium sp. W14]
MQNSVKTGFLAFLLVTLTLMTVSCGCTGNVSGNVTGPDQTGENLNVENESAISVAVSILPEKEFVEAIGKDLVNVTVMVPPGSSPHTYELTSGQLVSLSDADMYAELGSGIEFEQAWMDKIKGVNSGMKIVDCCDGIELINEGNGTEQSGNPHIWLSLKNAKVMADNICDGLCEISPENADYFRENLQNYESKLDALDENISEELSNSSGKTVMVYHPAWSYFARDYSLNQISIESEGKEPSPAALKQIIDQAEENNVTVVFASPEYSTKSAEVIADAIGGKVIMIDPLAEEYLENMKSVAKAFASE